VNRISRHPLNYLREYLVANGSLRTIGDLFGAEGFEPLEHSQNVTGERRNSIERYYAGIDWNSEESLRRALKIFQVVLARMETDRAKEIRAELLDLLNQDGFELDANQRLQPVGGHFVPFSSLNLADDVALGDYVSRMRESAKKDPEAAIGAAKELVESAAKYALEELGKTLSGSEEIPELVKMVQKELNLHTSSVAPSVRGAESIKRVLGGLSSIANGIAELRNQYGTGHGRAKKVSGLTERHARLAVNSASTYVDFLLSTLKDPSSPWKNRS
jgi:Abortive infection C-terminus